MTITLVRIAVLNKDEHLPCYKCGQVVTHNNSVIRFEAFLRPFGVSFVDQDCHLFPVEGEQPCIGSPSRFQYFEGYPKDPREAYAYVKDDEQPYREAYAQLLAET